MIEQFQLISIQKAAQAKPGRSVGKAVIESVRRQGGQFFQELLAIGFHTELTLKLPGISGATHFLAKTVPSLLTTVQYETE